MKILIVGDIVPTKNNLQLFEDGMADIARKVANGFEFVRVDFYELKNRAILGKMTFTPAACLGKYTEQGDKYLSDMLELNI